MKMNMDVGLSGRYKLMATNSRGQERIVADWFENLILDSGLNRLGTGGVFDRIYVGTGNSTPVATQTALDTTLASTTDRRSYTDGYDSVGSAYAFHRSTFRFGTGEAAGNLTEIGAGWASGLFSRALIKDSGGSPTTVTVLSDETLDVIYELRVYFPADVVGTVVISGVTHNIVLRPQQIGYNDANSHWNFQSMLASGMTGTNEALGGHSAYGPGALGDITLAPGGAYVGYAAGSTVGAYSNNSYERLYRLTFGLTGGSVPFTNISFQSRMGAYKASFDPPIAKDNTKVLTIDWKISWARRP